MKNGTPRRISVAMLVGTLMPLAAHAFVDERTPPPPPAPPAPLATHIAPTIVEPKLIVPIAQPAPAQAQVVPGVTTTVQSLQTSVNGDLSNPAWAGVYPGPFGSMPLADALIAQVVPVTGNAIKLDGPPELFEQRVVVPKGASRLQTLKAVADGHGLVISVNGANVTVSKALPAGAPTSPMLVKSETPIVTAETKEVKASPVIPVSEPVMTWKLTKGTMLSTAMLEWAEKWGWELIWKADVDYRLAADITLAETFLDGVGKVLDAYRTGTRPLWGDWNDEQKVLVIREPSSKK